MKIIHRVTACLYFLISASVSNADTSTGYDIFLLAGQSNMAGRGTIPSPMDADGAPDPSIKMWDPATNSIVTA